MDSRFLAVAALGVAVALGMSAPASAQEGDVEGIPTEDLAELIGPLEAVIVGHLPVQAHFLDDGDDEAPGEIVYDLYEQDSLVDLFTHLEDDESDPVELIPSDVHDTLKGALSAVHASGHDTIWVHFVSEGAARSASRSDLRRLGRRVDRQEVIASIYGSDYLLRELLRLPRVSLEQPHEHDGRLHVVRMNKAEDHLEQWTHEIPDAPTDRARFARAVIEFEHWLYEQRQDEILGAEATPDGPDEVSNVSDEAFETLDEGAAPPAIWELIHDQTFSGLSEGRVAWRSDPQVSGTWSVRLRVWYLSGLNAALDWYLIQLEPASQITNYGKTSKTCGWWTSRLQAALQIDDGALLEYMPQGALLNTSRDFAIGLAPSAVSGLPQFAARFQRNYGAGDLDIRTNANTSEDFVWWDASLRGCNGHGGFYWTGASLIASSSYKFSPAITAAIAAGRQLKFKLVADTDGPVRFTEVEHEKQHFWGQGDIVYSECSRTLDEGMNCVMEHSRQAAPSSGQMYCNPPNDVRPSHCQFVPSP